MISRIDKFLYDFVVTFGIRYFARKKRKVVLCRVKNHSEPATLVEAGTSQTIAAFGSVLVSQIRHKKIQ